MSVESISRIVASLALDRKLLDNYLPREGADDLENERRLGKFVEYFLPLLARGDGPDEVNEVELLKSRDFGRLFAYIGENLPRPLGGDDVGGFPR